MVLLQGECHANMGDFYKLGDNVPQNSFIKNCKSHCDKLEYFQLTATSRD